MSYVVLFMLVLSLIGGFLMGFFEAIKEISINPNSNLLKTKIQALKNRFQVRKRISNNTVLPNGLKARFTDDGNGYSDIVCDITDQNEAEYVEKLRKRQNISYSYTSRK